jgi:hypothetical protein
MIWTMISLADFLRNNFKMPMVWWPWMAFDVTVLSCDTLTLTLPVTLYYLMGQEANDCVLQTPSWKHLIGR